MSTFYGTVDGCTQTKGTRRGTFNSGILCSAQSYNGSVSVFMKYEDYDIKDSLKVTIGIDDYSCSYCTPKFSGTLDELEMCFALWNEYYDESKTKEEKI